MKVAAAIMLVTELVNGIAAASRAGRDEITESDLDLAMDEIAEGDDAVTAAIKRARAREENNDT